MEVPCKASATVIGKRCSYQFSFHYKSFLITSSYQIQLGAPVHFQGGVAGVEGEGYRIIFGIRFANIWVTF